jgi:DNA-binding MurR/RpiR family transcriptional regulator
VVATYAFKNPYDIAFGATAAIANDCSVSTPTVVAQTLGFERFREVREFFRRALRS